MSWLEQNPFFRKLYLLRKVFLSKRRQSHYAQFAEDVSIGKLFPDVRDGFFVDVGCFHPFKHNNTWMLYKRGWRGVNIDIDDIKIEAFEMLRPHDENIVACVSDESKTLKYYRHGFFSLMNSVDETFGQKVGEHAGEVAAQRLTDILDRTRFKDRQIDLLSVDAEGHDLQVLKSLDFERYNPRVIAVESHFRILEQVQTTEAYQLLRAKGYALTGWCGFTLLMANAEFCESLAPAA